jgi:hypothetical protein
MIRITDMRRSQNGYLYCEAGMPTPYRNLAALFLIGRA